MYTSPTSKKIPRKIDTNPYVDQYINSVEESNQRARVYIQNSNPNAGYDPNMKIDDGRSNGSGSPSRNKSISPGKNKFKIGALYNPTLMDPRF